MTVDRKELGERGATAVFVAIALSSLLGMVALGVDVGMLMKVRADAQRTADAAALAGAQDFLNASTPTLKDSALYHALEYASRNYVGWKYVDTSGVIVTDSGARGLIGNSPEAYVQVMPDTQKVRVYIRRNATATWFGSLFRIPFVKITVKAAAQAVNAGTGKCVKPFAIPDMWDDKNDDPNNNDLEDANQQQGKKGAETWTYGPEDTYSRYQDPNNPNSNQWTGYGSSFRNNVNDWYSADPNKYLYWNDYGRPMVLKVTNPGATPDPSFFQAWTMPYDSTDPGAYKGQSPNNGANWYKWNIENCNPVSVQLGVSYDSKPGNMVGPTAQGVSDLIAQDPNACWASSPDPNHTGYTAGAVKLMVGNACTGDYPGWQSSPRVAIVPLFDPSQIKSGRTALTFNNLAVIFIEGQDNAHSSVNGRFLFFAQSTGPLSPTSGSLVKKLQLVE